MNTTVEQITRDLKILLEAELGITIPLSAFGDPVKAHMDSLELIQLVMGVERQYKIVITDETIESIRTLTDLVKIIHDATAIAL